MNYGENKRLHTSFYFTDFKISTAEKNREITEKLKELNNVDFTNAELSYIKEILLNSENFLDFKKNLGEKNFYIENGFKNIILEEKKIEPVIDLIYKEMENHASNKPIEDTVYDSNNKIMGKL